MKQILSIISVFAFMILLSGSVLACSCVMPGTTQEEVDKHDSVFIGKVIYIRENTQTNTVKFNVSTIYKGDETLEVTTSSSSASCGFNFEKGKEYLIYANEQEGKMSVSLCSRTAQTSDSQEDIAYLDSVLVDPNPLVPVDESENNVESESFWQKITSFFKNFFS